MAHCDDPPETRNRSEADDMQASRTLRAGLLVAALAAGVTATHAVDWGMSESTLQDLSFEATQSLLIREVLRDARPDRRSSAPAAGASRGVTLAPRSDGSATARRLAARYPAEQRAAVERALKMLLERYHLIEDRFGIERHDVAGSAAAFIAGAWMAYRNQGFPDAHFKPLVEQMRTVLIRSREFAKADRAARTAMYEQLAILGMSMAAAQMSLQGRADADGEARMRATAKSQLERFLGVAADRVVIGEQGLVVR